MTELKRVTLISVDCYNYGGAVAAIKNSLKQIKPFAVKFLTDIEIEVEGIEVVKIEKISSKEQYSEFIVKRLADYFDTEFVLIIQHDGYVLNGGVWDDCFYNYDYIGAPWMETDGFNVGNGGFSLRSKKLQNAVKDDFVKETHPEDVQICRTYRPFLENRFGLKFAPLGIAEKFAFELRQPTQKTFGFHGYFQDEYMPVVQIRRMGAMGDVVSLEPVLHHFFKKGYRVVLETNDQFFILFQQHYFKIYHPLEIDASVPRTTVNLDMSYEASPKELHLKSYYNFAGVKDGKIRRPKLSLSFDARSKQYKLFPKYAIVHIDNREQPHRNIYGVNWVMVSQYLINLGYDVIQIGKNEHENIPNAIQFNCCTQELLLMACAGADLFVGVDSGVSHICVAFDVPSVIAFGSVNPAYIHPDLSNIVAIHLHEDNVCEKPFCWHDSITTVGQDCYIDKGNPPCTVFQTSIFLKAISKFTNEQSGIISNGN